MREPVSTNIVHQLALPSPIVVSNDLKCACDQENVESFIAEQINVFNLITNMSFLRGTMRVGRGVTKKDKTKTNV